MFPKPRLSMEDLLVESATANEAYGPQAEAQACEPLNEGIGPILLGECTVCSFAGPVIWKHDGQASQVEVKILVLCAKQVEDDCVE